MGHQRGGGGGANRQHSDNVIESPFVRRFLFRFINLKPTGIYDIPRIIITNTKNQILKNVFNVNQDNDRIKEPQTQCDQTNIGNSFSLSIRFVHTKQKQFLK